jgi:hypothetical protein
MTGRHFTAVCGAPRNDLRPVTSGRTELISLRQLSGTSSSLNIAKYRSMRPSASTVRLDRKVPPPATPSMKAVDPFCAKGRTSGRPGMAPDARASHRGDPGGLGTCADSGRCDRAGGSTGSLMRSKLPPLRDHPGPSRRTRSRADQRRRRQVTLAWREPRTEHGADRRREARPRARGLRGAALRRQHEGRRHRRGRARDARGPGRLHHRRRPRRGRPHPSPRRSHLTQAIDRLRRSGNVTGTKTLMVLDRWTPGRNLL